MQRFVEVTAPEMEMVLGDPLLILRTREPIWVTDVVMAMVLFQSTGLRGEALTHFSFGELYPLRPIGSKTTHRWFAKKRKIFLIFLCFFLLFMYGKQYMYA